MTDNMIENVTYQCNMSALINALLNVIFEFVTVKHGKYSKMCIWVEFIHLEIK